MARNDRPAAAWATDEQDRARGWVRMLNAALRSGVMTLGAATDAALLSADESSATAACCR